MSQTERKTPELVAILRGLTPERAPEVGALLVAAGFRTIEVPLNSPEPFQTIKLLSARHADCLVGAGTVLTAAEVDRVHDAGGRLVVAPNCEPAVIRRALELGMRVLPGIATATEAFTALGAGATELKLFPAATYGPRHLSALKSVLPRHVKSIPGRRHWRAGHRRMARVRRRWLRIWQRIVQPAYTLAEIDDARARADRSAAHRRRNRTQAFEHATTRGNT